MLKRYAEGDKAEQNAILSPQGIFHGLAMSYVASGGQTRKELASVLHFPDDDQKLIKDLADLHRDLEATPWYKPAKVTVASAVWIDSTYAEFRKDYVDMLGKGFSASLHAAKFADAAKVSGEVNHWVSQKTHGKITKTVSPDDFQSRSIPGVTINEPALVSVNAVYFKMDWGSRFEKGATKPGPFHVDSATTQMAPMMHQHSVLPYAANEDFQFLEIPYIDDQYSMYVLLPQKIIGIKDLMSRVTAQTVIDLKRHAGPCMADVLLPTFEFKGHYDIKDQLENMGATTAFGGGADFGKMIVPNKFAQGIYIGQVYHDAWIDFHKEGTEAAAATTTVSYSVTCSAQMRPQPVDFHADHPFLFAIVHNKSYSILFAGWIANPKGLTGPAR